MLGIELAPCLGRQGPGDTSPTLDRIVPEKGYVPGNVLVISNRANAIKSNANTYELFQVARFYIELSYEQPDLFGYEPEEE